MDHYLREVSSLPVFVSREPAYFCLINPHSSQIPTFPAMNFCGNRSTPTPTPTGTDLETTISVDPRPKSAPEPYGARSKGIRGGLESLDWTVFFVAI
jgi:hypothetical protein